MPGTLVLDCEGLSKLHLKDRCLFALVQAATEEDIRVVTAAMTTLEADHERVHPARVTRVLSRIDIRDVTKELTAQAAVLPRDQRMHGHKDAVGAVPAAIARSSPAPVTLATSAPDDLAQLCGPAAEIVAV